MENNIQLISIDRRSSVKYHYQIKDNIKALILDQSLYYGSLLPSVTSLADHLQIDVKIVQKAYDELSLEKVIQQKENGYSVIYIELTNHFFFRDTTIYDAIIELGLTPSIVCIEKKVIQLNADENKRIGFQTDESLLYIKRVYNGNDQPIIILENYLPLSIFPSIDEKLVGHEPLSLFLSEEYGIKTKLSNRKTKAVNLPPELSKLLKERKNIASIQSTNKIYDQFNRLVDYGISHAVSNYYFEAIVSRTEILNYYKK